MLSGNEVCVCIRSVADQALFSKKKMSRTEAVAFVDLWETGHPDSEYYAGIEEACPEENPNINLGSITLQ